MPHSSPILERIRALLRAEGVVIREVHHAPTRTSEESAAARGEPLAIGGKAIVMKVDERFGLFVFSAARRLDSNAVRRHLRASNSRFASPEELLALTGLVPGSVPPFGEPILPLPLYADTSVIGNERIAFNAGSLTDSIVMSVPDWRRLARPTMFAFTRDA
jgi:prolyl-tRNA editing enzyme YbaK/EbsC (Cys-tRNA(Pro) deacylase)